jgi:hypothetical protein
MELQIFINSNVPKQHQYIWDNKKPNNCNLSYIKNGTMLIDGYTIEGTLPKEILDNPSRKISLNPEFDKFINVFACGVKEVEIPNPNGSGENINRPLTNDGAKMMVKVIGDIFESLPEFKVTNIEFIGDWIVNEVVYFEDLHINGKIYKYTFQNGFLLYVLHYDLSVTFDGDWNDTKGESEVIERFKIEKKYIPIILTTNSNSIEYGLYKSYIPSGLYTCKLFEYTKQLDENEQRKGYHLGNGGFGHTKPIYYYVGDRHYDAYPWNKYPFNYDFSVPEQVPARKFSSKLVDYESTPPDLLPGYTPQEPEYVPVVRAQRKFSTYVDYGDTPPDLLPGQYKRDRKTPPPTSQLPLLKEDEGLEDEFAQGLQSKGVPNLSLSGNTWEPHNELKLKAMNL